MRRPFFVYYSAFILLEIVDVEVSLACAPFIFLFPNGMEILT